MITTSPTTHLRAAGPFRQTAPLPRPLDYISLQPLAVVDVDDLHLFAGDQMGRVEKVLVDRDATYVAEVGLRDGHPVYLGLEYLYLHVHDFVVD